MTKEEKGVTMFEKEAEEYANRYVSEGVDELKIKVIKEHWQDGAEFGYNKANEWHYVKDGINPTHSYRVLVFTDEGVGFGIYGLDNKKWYTYDTGFDVIAWKEIVLPKEIE
jgi:hypothetical protein